MVSLSDLVRLFYQFSIRFAFVCRYLNGFHYLSAPEFSHLALAIVSAFRLALVHLFFFHAQPSLLVYTILP